MAAAAATASPSQRRRSDSSRPLSAAQLLFPESNSSVVVGSGDSGKRDDVTAAGVSGVENTAFELGSPLTPAATTTPLFPDREHRTSAATPQGDDTMKRRQPSWLLDRRKDDLEMWRRRKTDPPGDGKYSYHRDYQEALSSLLWQPYDCRGQSNHTLSSNANLDDDADVSVWLYPPPPVPRRQKQESEPTPFSSFRSSNCHSSSSSTTSMSSSSSSAVVMMASSSAPDEMSCWRRQERNSNHVGRTVADPDPQQEDIVVSDPIGTPLGALQSRYSSTGVADCCQCLEEQRAGCCSLCDAMLVTVQGHNANNVTTTEEELSSLVPPQPAVGIVSNSASSSTMNNNSVSVVNCYRAIPVRVSNNNSDFNVNVVQTTPVVETTPSVVTATATRTQRTFTSTEAQTDDIGSAGVVTTPVIFPPNARSSNREQRRRERRERRHQRRLNNQNSIAGAHHHQPVEVNPWQTQVLSASVGERLPDILNSHLPPPYTTLPPALGLPPPVPPHVPPPPLPGSPTHPPPLAVRFPFQLTPTVRRRTRGQHYTPEEEPKSCCGVVVTQTVSIRWFIVMIAFVGICCAVVGTVLGAMKASGREHLTVSLLMIGVGIVLITVSAVAWRLTAHDAPSCRMMLGLGGSEESGAEPNRRFVPRLPPSYGRPHHPYAAMMYPEFQHRPPPPSYQASMQEYRLRLLLLDRHSNTSGAHTVSPPPTYRSHAGSTLSRATLGLRRDPQQSEYSRPPSYRSRTSSTRPTMDPTGSVVDHSRDPSLSISDSGGGSAVVNVISVTGTEPETLDSIKVLPEQDIPLRMMLNKGGHSGSAKDGNLVTIVQTDNGTSPVIVTVSGSTIESSTSGNGVDPEMEILAHL